MKKDDTVYLRDKLIHGYFGVDLDVVWETATRDIYDLEAKIKMLIKQ